jgi:hypothetical protein
MSKIYTVAYVPEGLEQAWLQHLRDFDARYPQCHFEVMAEVPDKPMAEIVEMMRVNPTLDFTTILERKP